MLTHTNKLNHNNRYITTHHEPHPLNIQNIKRSPLPIVYHDKYSVEPWSRQHSFRMPKFKLLYQHLSDNNFNFKNSKHPQLPSELDISIAHSISYVILFLSRIPLKHCVIPLDYINSVETGDIQAYKSMNLPYSPALAERAKLSLNGTLTACELALQHGIAAQISGGYHHAHKEYGTGFCIFNDLAYSALHLLSKSSTNGIRNICILDLDVHQGDGTAAILSDVDNVLTISVHCEANFPFEKQKSDIDIGLDTDLTDIQYLQEIKDLMEYIIKEKHKNGYRIDLVIYDGGVDIHKKDKLGRLNISDNGLIERDKIVFDTCLSNDIPIACVVGGGYDVNDQVLAERHGFLHWNALEIWNKYNLG